MKWVLDEFEVRVTEVEQYFSFITTIERNNSIVAMVKSNGSVEELMKFDPDLTRILKANAFLLLYNLIESTVTNAMFEIFTSIKKDKTCYLDISEQLKKVWLDLQLNHDKNTEKKSLVDQMTVICDDVINRTLIEIEKKQIKFKGNLDASKIFELAKIYGINNHPTFRIDTVGTAFKEVKNKRNSLAHGDLTFKECGRDFTIQKLTEYKLHVIEYLGLVLSNIDSYIDQKQYLCA